MSTREIEKGRQESGPELVAAGRLRPWEVADLPEPRAWKLDIKRVIGPGLMMAGAAIGGGEWLMGPAVTAQYGGTVMWIATLSILFQAVYNLEIMRYALYCGEPIFVGFFRTPPGPKLWTAVYLLLDFASIWPYLSASAAVIVVAAFIGELPSADHRQVTGWVAYGIFLASFVPLLFGGKIYNALEKLMVAKIVLVLGYLSCLSLAFVDWSTWAEIFLGFVGFQPTGAGGVEFKILPDLAPGQKLDWLLLAAFVAIAGQGGLTNVAFSNYVREKGWGMGSLVGAIPSAVGGKGIKLSHHGKVFKVTEQAHRRWRGWQMITVRDQLGIWVVGCLLGMGIPALVSLQFVRGSPVRGEAVAAMTADGLVNKTQIPALWFLTLLCGFLVLAPSQVSTIDGLVRRWTDVLWTGSRRLGRVPEENVAYVYYGMVAAYAVWGLFVLTFLPDPLLLVKLSPGVLYNFALGASALHVLAVNCTLLPQELRPGWFMRLSLVFCAAFFLSCCAMALPQAARELGLVK